MLRWVWNWSMECKCLLPWPWSWGSMWNYSAHVLSCPGFHFGTSSHNVLSNKQKWYRWMLRCRFEFQIYFNARLIIGRVFPLPIIHGSCKMTKQIKGYKKRWRKINEYVNTKVSNTLLWRSSSSVKQWSRFLLISCALDWYWLSCEKSHCIIIFGMLCFCCLFHEFKPLVQNTVSSQIVTRSNHKFLSK